MIALGACVLNCALNYALNSALNCPLIGIEARF